jgi:DNA-binding LytR/AlgR family response regulator
MKTPVQILIVEDDNLLARRIERDLEKEGFGVTDIVGNMTHAVSSVKKRAPDLALIDIKLNGPEDGITTGKELLKIAELPIIYITGEPYYLETAKRSEGTHPAAFLEKPLRPRELIVQVNLAINNFYAGLLPLPKSVMSDYILLFIGKEYVNIRQSHILFLEANGAYTNVYLSQEEFQRLYPKGGYSTLLASPNLGRIYTDLQPYFYKISRGYIINLRQVSRLNSNEIIFVGHTLPIPEGKRAELLNNLNVMRNKRG